MQPPAQTETPGWLKALGEALAHIFAALGPILSYLFWGALILALLGVVVLIAREVGWIDWAGAGGKKKAQASADQYRPEAEVAHALLADADALAAQGQFAEAVHTLLLRSIEDMRRFRPHSVRPAATSRDLAGLGVLPEAARPAFELMAEAVETSLFGGRAVDAHRYEACRKAYEFFAFAKVWA